MRPVILSQELANQNYKNGALSLIYMRPMKVERRKFMAKKQLAAKSYKAQIFLSHHTG